MITHVNSPSEFDDVLHTKGKLVVVDFFASWCGPCRQIAPAFESLSSKYPNVLFAKVQQDTTGGSICQQQGIRGFPTFRFFVDGQLVDELVGADPEQLEQKIIQHMSSVPQSFGGTGFSLGSSGQTSATSAREARLKRFGGGSSSSTTLSSATVTMPEESQSKMDDDDDLQAALLMSMQCTDAESCAKLSAEQTQPTEHATQGAEDVQPAEDTAMDTDAPEMIDPPVDEALLQEVTAMEFPELRVRKALLAGNSNVEAVINWVLEHSEDTDIDEPIPQIPSTSSGTQGAPVRSWRCVETGRLFRTMDELQLYAEKTGRSNFEESTEEKKPLTQEEIQVKKEALKRKLAERRAERNETEKVDEVTREKQRREMGQQMQVTREQMEKDKRMREYAKQKREKEAAKRERERLRAESV